jgi:hypothetical protein
LVEKEAAGGGEISWIAKQRLWAHNLGSLAALAVEKKPQIIKLKRADHSPEPALPGAA